MKAWRKEAAALKKWAVGQGLHERGQRYGKSLRDYRRMPAQRPGLVSPLFAALLERPQNEQDYD